MSRSYREPWYTQGYGGNCRRWQKHYANRVVRRAADVPDGKAYRKYYNSWDICDWRWIHDPYPRYYWRDGERHSYGPDPLWWVNRK